MIEAFHWILFTKGLFVPDASICRGIAAAFILAEAASCVGTISGIRGLYSIAACCDDTYRREAADNQEIWTLILLFHCSDDKDTIIQCAKIDNYSLPHNFSGIFFEKIGERSPKWRQNGGTG